MGRPPYKPTDEVRKIVRNMASVGIPHRQLAAYLGIDRETLAKYFGDELEKGKIEASVKVLENLFRMATGSGREAAACAMFWAKTQCGFREIQRLEHSGPDGDPISLAAVDAPPQETREQWLERKRKEAIATDGEIKRLVTTTGAANGSGNGHLV